MAPTLAARPSPKVFSPMTVTFAALDARVRVADREWEPLRAGGQLSANSAFSGGRTVLATLSGPRLVLEAEGSLAVGGQAMVVLGAGFIGAMGDSEVLAGTRRVMSLDAAYRVERTAAEVVVEVASGQVELFDESSTRRRVVVAPARLRWADGTSLDEGVTEPVTGWRIASAPTAPAAVLDLSGLPDGTLISIDGQLFGSTPLRLMLEAGRHAVQVTLPGKPMQERFIDLVGGQPFQFAMAPEAERPVEAPEPDAQALARVMEDLRLLREVAQGEPIGLGHHSAVPAGERQGRGEERRREGRPHRAGVGDLSEDHRQDVGAVTAGQRAGARAAAGLHAREEVTPSSPATSTPGPADR
jgi:hypothetical protein